MLFTVCVHLSVDVHTHFFAINTHVSTETCMCNVREIILISLVSTRVQTSTQKKIFV